jgi:hypothetical protein
MNYDEPFHVESGDCARCDWSSSCSDAEEGARIICSSSDEAPTKLLFWEDSPTCAACEKAEKCAAAMAARKAHCPKQFKPGPHPKENGWPYHPDSLHCKGCASDQVAICQAHFNLPAVPLIAPKSDEETATK